MRQAIVTKYLGPTNQRGGRVKATCESGSITMPWNCELDVQDNHRTAAEDLMLKLGWASPDVSLKGGGYKNGYVFVQVWNA